ncbi:metal-dependent transcriptional regulator [Treponema sp. TIM-1]|uniref:metal-dependent transcriptional regulator n=1 Tax=Treponema sp. TIM-1 TaxID=2898417 RepID=UPI003980EB18
MMTPSLEDYLKMIDVLSDKGNVRVTDMALRLGVSKPSVVSALKRLEDNGMVEHERYRYVSLTQEGKRRADEIRARNSLLIVFLQDTLGVSSGNAEKDACKLEHTVSDETLKKIRILVKNFGER